MSRSLRKSGADALVRARPPWSRSCAHCQPRRLLARSAGGVSAAAGVAEMAAWPAVSELVALSQTARIPPETWINILTATKATKAVSRQYSARSCPRSSECKAIRKRRNIALTKPNRSLVLQAQHDHDLFRYATKPGRGAVFSRAAIKSHVQEPI